MAGRVVGSRLEPRVVGIAAIARAAVSFACHLRSLQAWFSFTQKKNPTPMPSHSVFRTTRLCGAIIAMCAALAACSSSDDDPIVTPPIEEPQPPQPPEPERTPVGLTLEKIGGYATGRFDEAAAEIPAFDAASKRAFIVNARAGAVHVLDLADPANPVRIGGIDAGQVLADADLAGVDRRTRMVKITTGSMTRVPPAAILVHSQRQPELHQHRVVKALVASSCR